jgi:NitT/TauT family transport system permease protein
MRCPGFGRPANPSSRAITRWLFALYPLLVVILGVGTAPIVFTGTLYAAMSVLIGTLSGLDHVPRVFRKVAKVHRLGPLKALAGVYIPSCSAEIRLL